MWHSDQTGLNWALPEDHVEYGYRRVMRHGSGGQEMRRDGLALGFLEDMMTQVEFPELVVQLQPLPRKVPNVGIWLKQGRKFCEPSIQLSRIVEDLIDEDLRHLSLAVGPENGSHLAHDE